MKKLLIISEKFWPNGGGAELATYLISKILSRHYDVSILTSSKSFQANYAKISYVPWLEADHKFALWLKIIKNKDIIERIVRKHDIIYIPRASFPVIPLAKKLNKKVIVHLHDYIPICYNAIVTSNKVDSLRVMKFELMEHGSIGRALIASFLSPLNKLSKLWISKADRVICVSKKQAEIIAQQAPELARKLKVIYNPLPQIRFIKKDIGNPTLLYLGGDSYVKGFYIFLKAANFLLKQNKKLKFLITGNLRKSSRELIDKLNRNNKAYILFGRLKYKDVLKLHSSAMALLFPSIWEEPLPYVVIESMLAGTIPIASNVGGVPEIVKETYAEKILFSPGDVDSLVRSIWKVQLLSKEQMLNVGIEMRKKVLERFNSKIIEDKLIESFS
jgi:glycosyltransferase involved in cell wall biosynthesis